MDAAAGKQAARDAGAAVHEHPAFRWLVTIGLICYGLIHLLLGWLCIQVALGGGGETSEQGALRDLVSKPFGNVLMIVVAGGLFALALWQALEAAFGYRQAETKTKVRRRASAVGRTVVYAALGVSALMLALGSRGSDQNRQAQGWTANLMSVPFGQVLVGLLGLAIIVVGGSQVVKGIRRKFVERDLAGGVPEWAKMLGSVGWCAKGAALALVGGLILWAAIQYDPGQAAGLDGALKSLLNQPFGVILLVAMGVGFAAFGAYCFVWAFNADHEEI